MPLVYAIVSRYANRNMTNFSGSIIEYDELISTGSLALINAIDTFDLNKGFQFSTYATR